METEIQELNEQNSNLTGLENAKIQEAENRHREQLQRLVQALQNSKEEYANLEAMHNVMLTYVTQKPTN